MWCQLAHAGQLASCWILSLSSRCFLSNYWQCKCWPLLLSFCMTMYNSFALRTLLWERQGYFNTKIVLKAQIMLFLKKLDALVELNVANYETEWSEFFLDFCSLMPWITWTFPCYWMQFYVFLLGLNSYITYLKSSNSWFHWYILSPFL